MGLCEAFGRTTYFKAPLAIAGVAFALGLTAARPVAEFTFRDAEFMTQTRDLEVAERFVAGSFPAGLPLVDARTRATRAGMTCRTQRSTSSVACRYSMPVHAKGGIIGDNTWILELSADQRGNFQEAVLRYERGGIQD